MIGLRSFLRAQSGATAAEFAMVLPVALLFMLGTIDVGRYFWIMNELEKAVQAGTRYAVATKVVAGGLNAQTYTNFNCSGTTLKVGAPICRDALGTVTCTKAGSAVSCTCAPSAIGNTSCPTLTPYNAAAFDAIVHRMQVMYGGISLANVRIRYSGSGIGFAGDPVVDGSNNPLSEISPIVTVELNAVRFRSMSLLGVGLQLPGVRYSQTLEDGDGTVAY